MILWNNGFYIHARGPPSRVLPAEVHASRLEPVQFTRKHGFHTFPELHLRKETDLFVGSL